MRSTYSNILNPAPKVVPQSQPLPKLANLMHKNDAGGHVFTADVWTQLNRFLILGSEAGTFYVSPEKHTTRNIEVVENALKTDPIRTINEIVRVSTNGLAIKNDPALVALALAASFVTKNGELQDRVRTHALNSLPRVARTGTHLLHFTDYVNGLRGWGRGLKRSVANWFTDKEADKIAYQAVKYKQRDGWSMRDVVRLAHPKVGHNTPHQAVLRYIVDGNTTPYAPRIITQVEMLKGLVDSPKKAAKLIADSNIPWEAVPTELQRNVDVMAALVPNMGSTALVRQLGRLSNLGLLEFGSDTTRLVLDKIRTMHEDKNKVHPIAILIAMKTYASGHGFRGSLTWKINQRVLDALDGAFYNGFAGLDRYDASALVAVDGSGSMFSANIDNTNLTAGEAAAAVALVAAQQYTDFHTVRYTTRTYDFNISPRDRLDTVIEKMRRASIGEGTDCAQPYLYAKARNMSPDVIISITDNETWAGHTHPAVALEDLRKRTRKNIRAINLATSATSSRLSYPNDPYALEVVGFSADVPQVISSFLSE